MRMTIVPEDKLVNIDGLVFSELDLSFIPTNVHAIQWYGEEGTVEIKDERNRIIETQDFTDLTPYQPALDAWQVAKNVADQQEPTNV